MQDQRLLAALGGTEGRSAASLWMVSSIFDNIIILNKEIKKHLSIKIKLTVKNTFKLSFQLKSYYGGGRIAQGGKCYLCYLIIKPLQWY